MTTFQNGDRVRLEIVGEDGLPLVKYGFIGSLNDDGPAEVLLDDELGGALVDVSHLEPVNIGNLTLKLQGTDLLHDPSLRQALVNMWRAEAESAGLQVSALEYLGTGAQDTGGGYTLAELSSGGTQYVLRAHTCDDDPDAIAVAADLPRRWELRSS